MVFEANIISYLKHKLNIQII